MAKLPMTEFLQRPTYDTERTKLQDHLAAIDRDPEKLQTFIAELYTDYSENPHMLYAAATHLNAITYLDRRDITEEPVLPEAQDAARAFTAYTHLISMLGDERETPRYIEDMRIRQRLVGAREELAFHAIQTYATAQGADFVTLPSPAHVDFTGASEASDIQIFFPGTNQLPAEVQVTYNVRAKAEYGHKYDPRIPVLSLAAALGSNRASQIRGLLKDIGDRDDMPDGKPPVRQREHNILLQASADIMRAVKTWNSQNKK